MKKHFGLLFFLAGMLISGVAFAQNDSKIQTISFEDDHIEGDLMMPNSEVIKDETPGYPSNLIKVRDEFEVNVRKSVDEL